MAPASICHLTADLVRSLTSLGTKNSKLRSESCDSWAVGPSRGDGVASQSGSGLLYPPPGLGTSRWKPQVSTPPSSDASPFLSPCTSVAESLLPGQQPGFPNTLELGPRGHQEGESRDRPLQGPCVQPDHPGAGGLGLITERQQVSGGSSGCRVSWGRLSGRGAGTLHICGGPGAPPPQAHRPGPALSPRSGCSLQ